MTASGKYGAIGLNKSPDASQQQWSGLQQSMGNNHFDLSGASNNNLGGNVLKIVDAMSKNGTQSSLSSHHPYGGINGNFLNINVS